MPKGVDHVRYVPPGVVDGAKMKADAEFRYHHRDGEVSIVHWHNQLLPGNTDLHPCNEQCAIYKEVEVTNDDGTTEMKGVWLQWNGQNPTAT